MSHKPEMPATLVKGIYEVLLNHSHANRTKAAEEISEYVIEKHATKLHQVQQENAELNRQNDKMKEQAEGWRVLLEEVLSKHNTGKLPDHIIYEKIKKFLYGE